MHHRATHSKEAMSASLNMAFLLSLAVIGILATKMWTDKTHRAIQQRQPVQFDSHSVASEILVKDMIRKRARTLVNTFHKLKTRSKSAPPHNNRQELRMESFIREGAPLGKSSETDIDQLDSGRLFHQRLLLSSSESSSSDGLSLLETSDDEEGNSVYSLNTRTGEWGGSKKANDRLNKRSWAESAVAFWRRNVSRRRKLDNPVRFSLNRGDESDSSHIRLLAETSSSDEEQHPFRVG